MLKRLAENKTRVLTRMALSILGTGLLVSASGASTLLLTGCELCSDESLQTITSPDRHLIAEAKLRDCGATTDYASHVTVRKNRSLFNQEVTVFVANHDLPINIQWQDNEHLRIECRSCYSKDVFRQATKAGAVTIAYDLPKPN